MTNQTIDKRFDKLRVYVFSDLETPDQIEPSLQVQWKSKIVMIDEVRSFAVSDGDPRRLHPNRFYAALIEIDSRGSRSATNVQNCPGLDKTDNLVQFPNWQERAHTQFTLLQEDSALPNSAVSGNRTGSPFPRRKIVGITTDVSDPLAQQGHLSLISPETCFPS
ncbi:MAG: hypothetical protein WCA19_08005 [Candidatus Acidiferrales bacterium]